VNNKLQSHKLNLSHMYRYAFLFEFVCVHVCACVYVYAFVCIPLSLLLTLLRPGFYSDKKGTTRISFEGCSHLITPRFLAALQDCFPKAAKLGSSLRALSISSFTLCYFNVDVAPFLHAMSSGSVKQSLKSLFLPECALLSNGVISCLGEYAGLEVLSLPFRHGGHQDGLELAPFANLTALRKLSVSCLSGRKLTKIATALPELRQLHMQYYEYSHTPHIDLFVQKPSSLECLVIGYLVGGLNVLADMLASVPRSAVPNLKTLKIRYLELDMVDTVDRAREMGVRLANLDLSWIVDAAFEICHSEAFLHLCASVPSFAQGIHGVEFSEQIMPTLSFLESLASFCPNLTSK